jgi:hypothetical protein
VIEKPIDKYVVIEGLLHDEFEGAIHAKAKQEEMAPVVSHGCRTVDI